MKAIEYLVGLPFSEIHLKRKNIVITPSTIKRSVQIKDDLVEINPIQLFHRMVCVVRSDEELSEIMKHELAPWPTALFEQGIMRKGAGKSALISVIESYCKPLNCLPNDVEITFTIDGGYLLHKCIWERYENFGDIIRKYVSYVTDNFGSSNVTVVFDGYVKSSTKDYEHARRGLSSECLVDENTAAVLSQETFLCNAKNKEELIKFLSNHLRSAGVTVLQAESDADSLIVSTAVERANEGRTSVLVGEDTDLLVLMIAHANCDTFMMIPGKGNRNKKIHSSKKLQEALGEMKQHMLFIHAISGCDTTSSIFGKGKSKIFQKLKNDKEMQQTVSVFYNSSSSPKDIERAGALFIGSLYGGKKDESLNVLRYKLYVNTVGKQKLDGNFKLSSLPPTSSAAKFHSYRVFFQIQEWNDINLNPLEWGWKLVNKQLYPVHTDEEPVPKQLLHLVACNCKKGCDSRNCACVKHGLKCSDMCRNCSGYGCSNRQDPIEEDADDLQDDLIP